MENLYSQQTICQELSNTNTDKERKPKTNGLKKKKRQTNLIWDLSKHSRADFAFALKFLKLHLDRVLYKNMFGNGTPFVKQFFQLKKRKKKKRKLSPTNLSLVWPLFPENRFRRKLFSLVPYCCFLVLWTTLKANLNFSLASRF